MPTFVLALFSSLVGCTQPPVYSAISTVTVHTQDSHGTRQVNLTGDKLNAAKRCLTSTVEIPQEDSDPEVLQNIIMLQVKDRIGDRMFELYTDENFKGNKGKYYRNTCIFRIIRG